MSSSCSTRQPIVIPVFAMPNVLDVTRRTTGTWHSGSARTSAWAHIWRRLEIRVMFEELLRRMPDWELCDPEEPEIIPADVCPAYDRIRIRFTPR